MLIELQFLTFWDFFCYVLLGILPVVFQMLYLGLSVTCDMSLVFSWYSNKTDRHDITEILLKVALNTITKLFLGN
jgi:uncharacterized membrane protein YdjX (TVP38/TMEM64 family)